MRRRRAHDAFAAERRSAVRGAIPERVRRGALNARDGAPRVVLRRLCGAVPKECDKSARQRALRCLSMRAGRGIAMQTSSASASPCYMRS